MSILHEWEKECFLLPDCTGLDADVGDPGTGISNAHKKPLTDNRTFWLS